VLYDDLSNKGTEDNPTMYFDGKPFTGVAFDVYINGELMYETSFKDGKIDGWQKAWSENNQLIYDGYIKDGLPIGLCRKWNEDGQLLSELNYTNEAFELNKRLLDIHNMSKIQLNQQSVNLHTIDTENIVGLIEQDFIKMKLGLITEESLMQLINSTKGKEMIIIPADIEDLRLQ